MNNKKRVNIDFYENKRNYNQEVISEKELQADYFLSRIGTEYIKKGSKVLDVGCGTGIIGAKIQSRLKASVVGMDLSQEMVKVAKKNGIETKTVDLDQRWPFNSSSFDCVIIVQVLEHVFNPDNLIQESRRVLKTGGCLIVTTPNLAAWFNRILLLLGFQPFFTEVSTKDKTIGLKFTRKITPNREPVGHLRVFTLAALEDLLKLYGFDIIQKTGGRVSYFPRLMSTLDYLFSFFPALATDLIVVATK